MTEIDRVKDRMRFMWAQGDYSEVAKRLMPAADALVDACRVGPGASLLDVAAGTGNVAVAAARRGAKVIATDLTPELVERGRRRTVEEGLDVEWREADAEELPFEDDRFDVVTSAFGAMLAPRASIVTEELMRVTKPGGVVGFTSWYEGGYQGQTMAVTSKYAAPSAEDVDGPLSWANPDAARRRFEPFASSVSVTTAAVPWKFDSEEEWREWAETNVPSIVAAKQTLPEEVYRQMRREAGDVAARFNKGTGGRIEIDSEYLLLVAEKKR